MIRVASFDIFDTCLTRTYAYPIDLFLEVGEVARNNGWVELDPFEFASRRVAAESAARDLVASREVSFAQIYQQLGLRLGLAPEILSKIQQIELQIEGQSLQPIAGTLQQISEARQAGHQILFLSDMYLPSSFLESLLKKHEFYLEGDALHVSGEIGRHKSDGGLFEHARSQLKVEIAEWIHVGDNAHSDVVAPRRLGFKAEHFESGLLNRYELRICPHIRYRHRLKSNLMKATGLDHLAKLFGRRPRSLHRERWQSRLVAAMRLARLAKPRDLMPQEKTIWDTGANLAGPLFYGYVKWVLAQAEAQKLSRLYFVARDGQILLVIAQIIESFRKNPIDCRYLLGSRHAWLPASLCEIDEMHLRWILAPTPGLTLRDVFARLEIAPENHQALLETAGFTQDVWEKSLTQAQRSRLAELLKNSALSVGIKAMAETKRENLLQYLRRERLFEQDKIGMVDLGWRGSLKQALAQVCELAPDPIKPQITGFHFALVNSPHRNDESFCGYVNSLRPDLLGGFHFYMQLLEAFAVADHGQVRGYAQGQTILAHSDNPPATMWGLDALRGGILAFCQAYQKLDDQEASPANYLEATLSTMELFYEDPTAQEVMTWGAFPFSDQQVERDLSSLVPAWNRSQAIAALLTKDGRKRLWWAPALARREEMPLLRLYYRLQKLWRTQLKPGAK